MKLASLLALLRLYASLLSLARWAHMSRPRGIGRGAWTVLPELSQPQSRLPRRIGGAGTLTSVFMVTLQVVPDTVVQPAAHPPNVCPLLGVAVSATEEPDANAAEHMAPQSIPDGELTMTPFTPPVRLAALG
jgi:hypothetical protein